jgi:hypothetical protein
MYGYGADVVWMCFELGAIETLASANAILRFQRGWSLHLLRGIVVEHAQLEIVGATHNPILRRVSILWFLPRL